MDRRALSESTGKPPSCETPSPWQLLLLAILLWAGAPGGGARSSSLLAGDAAGRPFLRGDCDADGDVGGSINDAIFLLRFNFLGGSTPSCLDACDADDSGDVTGSVTDALYLLQFSFLGGQAPPPPFPDCGVDPTPDALTCAGFLPCLVPVDPCDDPAPPNLSSPLAATVDDWHYQLQGPFGGPLTLPAIELTDFDLVVIDYSSRGDEAGEFTPAEILRLKASPSNPDQPKLVLAYLSIGEAETVRFYFDNSWVSPSPAVDPNGPFTLTASAPPWMVAPNPQFPDNFKVRYWDPEWQQIIVANAGGHPIIANARSYLDRIIDSGFDGVYLDVVDAYEFFGPDEIGGNDENRGAANDMVDLVSRISRHARETRGAPGFLVFIQNGLKLVCSRSHPDADDPAAEAQAQLSRLFGAIDGLGIEDAFHPGDLPEDNPLRVRERVLRETNLYRDWGKLVLAIDYLTDISSIDNFYALAKAENWVPYSSVRDLDRISFIPTQPPD